jgi:hypothetical protein
VVLILRHRAAHVQNHATRASNPTAASFSGVKQGLGDCRRRLHAKFMSFARLYNWAFGKAQQTPSPAPTTPTMIAALQQAQQVQPVEALQAQQG